MSPGTPPGRIATDEHPFDVDTRVGPVEADGTVPAVLSPRWSNPGGGANGGYTAAVCLSALREVLPGRDPLVVSLFYLRPAPPGPVEIRTEVVRRGRRVSTGQARLVADGRELVRCTASFTDLGGIDPDPAELSRAPELPAPEDCVDPPGGRPLPGQTITERVRYRYPPGSPWLGGGPRPGPDAELWVGFTGGRAADTWSLPLLVDSALPVVFALGYPNSVTVELTVHVRRRPAPGWLACRVLSRHVAHGYVEEDLELWDVEGRLVAQSRQLSVLSARPGAPS